MFSGKTTAMIGRIARAVAAQQRVYVFKHASDTRYEERDMCSHAGMSVPAVALRDIQDLAGHVNRPGLIALDEAQFFDAALSRVCRELADQGHALLVAGLDLDSWGLPFESMRLVMEQAETVTRFCARCAVCDAPAERTQRLVPVEEINMIGGAEAYEPRCVEHFVAPPIELRR